MATECSWNDGSKIQYYVVILDQLQGRSGGLEQAPESQIRGPLTVGFQLYSQLKKSLHKDMEVLGITAISMAS